MKVRVRSKNSVVNVSRRIIQSAMGRASDPKEKEYLRWGMSHIKDEDKVSLLRVVNRVEGEDQGRRCVILICNNRKRVMLTFAANAAKGPLGFKRPTIEYMPCNSSSMTVPRTIGDGDSEKPMPEQVFYHDSNDYRNRPLPTETMKEFKSRARHWRSAKRLI